MFKIYSNDLRERVVAYVQTGHSPRGAARYFDVSPSFVVKLMRRYEETGSVDPARRGQPAGKGKLSPYHVFLAECVEATPDITLRELAEPLQAENGVTAALESMSSILKCLGFTYNKNADGHRTWTRGCAGQTQEMV